MNNISFVIAFSAGLLSFLSPCVLPLVPAYISYLTGETVEELKAEKSKLTTLYKAIGFSIGFSIIFIAMGASATSLGKLIFKHRAAFRMVGGILIILFGIHMTGLLKIKLLYMERRLLSFKIGKGAFSSVLIGMAFATGWTPCAGPILASILIYAGSMDTLATGTLLLTVYSLGLAVPFILTALAIESFSNHLRSITKHMRGVSFVSGILMIIMGIMIVTNTLGILSRYMNFFNI